MDVIRVPRRRTFLGAMVVGTAVGLIITLWQVRQAGMDSGLIAAIIRDDSPAALRWLDEGADANAETWIGLSSSPAVSFEDLLSRLLCRPSRARGFHASALYLVYSRRFRPRYPAVRNYSGRSVRIAFGRAGERNAASAGPSDPDSRKGNTHIRSDGQTSPPHTRPRKADDPDATDDLLLVKALLDHGADPNVHPGPSGPLQMALRLRRPDAVRLLLDHRADPNARDEGGILPLMIADPASTRLLVAHGAAVNAHGYQGLTPLMCAAADPDSTSAAERVDLLLKAGADVSARDVYLQTPLMHALDVPAAALLLQHGADVEARDRQGMTTLMMDCANFSAPSLPVFLIRNGAKILGRDAGGKSAADYARQRLREAMEDTDSMLDRETRIRNLVRRYNSRKAICVALDQGANRERLQIPAGALKQEGIPGTNHAAK